MTRAEHLAWCKDRALTELECGRLDHAAASMVSDLQKHPIFEDEHALLGTMLLAVSRDVQNGDVEAVRRWIEGFN
jgi:hypothetical protein